VDAIDGILEAFQSHAVVMLGHAHGNEQKHRFLLSLVRDPRFARAVNDIVEECGSARYQEVMDRFTSGSEVPLAELRQVWENTVSANTNCDLPMYEEFFRAVRDVNRSLPRDRQIRVLLGDAPNDWEQVKSFADLMRWDEQRDEHAAGVIRRDVLAKGRRALVLFGEMHAQRRNERSNYEEANMLAGLLERGGATRVFNVWPNLGSGKPELTTLQADAASWTVPGLVRLRGTALGALDFSAFLTSDGRLGPRDGKLAPLPREQWKPLRMEEQFDALLYLGPVSAMTFQRLSRERCSDAAYLEMRTRRMAIVPGSQPQIERLRKYCASLLAPQG
jgi:hypothetical protein